VYRHFDGAGVATTDLYDFKGNPLRNTRQFARDYKTSPDWSRDPALEREAFSAITAYDALNRAIAVTAPDKSIYRPKFNEANLLEAVDVNLRGTAQAGQPVWTPFVLYINYDAKGQRTIVKYANGAVTTYHYDDKTFRLVHLKTTRDAGQSRLPAHIFKDAGVVQDLRYTYDPIGNITRIEDRAAKTVFHDNQEVHAAADYRYDPIYRLIEATGREHIAQSALDFSPGNGDYRDYPFTGAERLSDLQALQNFTERYEYDAVGNFQQVCHKAPNNSWTRTYKYHEPSETERHKSSNRLSETVIHGASELVERYSYDAHGNTTQMPHMPSMQWNFKDELSTSSRQIANAGEPETTFYVYDASGNRARKVTARRDGRRKSERFYVGGFEVYREFGPRKSISLERQTLHVMDDKQRIALVETKTVDRCDPMLPAASVQRYQFSNHLGSSTLEMDEAGALISYEEYSPYGNSTFQAGRSAAEIRLKRYRYTGKERDEENGFTYHGARYYAPWLGRWTACDPGGTSDALSSYARFAHFEIAFQELGV
jgi:RHS repeat-associated protein